MCYSDLSALYGAREINKDVWPYSSPENSVEYPVITGIVMWATGLLIGDENGYRQYFDLNALLIAFLMIAAAVIVRRMRPEYASYFPLAPAVIGSLYINWDLWAVVPALISLLLFSRQRRNLSALFLGIAIATKFFPIVILIGVSLVMWRSERRIKLLQFFAITFGTWALINIPVALSNYDGWWRFFKLNIERKNDLGSLWYALSLLKLPTLDLNYFSILLFLLTLFALTYFYRLIPASREQNANLMTISFLAVAAFVTISKVYSPQYILWLTPLAVIAMTRSEERRAFWIWQGGEALYHLAIWQYLASYTGAKFGMPTNIYALVILIRIATLAHFSAALIRTARLGISPQSTSTLFSPALKA
jgi:uncharacterized membrane protein